MNENKPDEIKEYLNYIPVYTAIFLFLGYFNQSSYYKFFNIDIWSYLTTGELLLSFLQITILCVLLVVASIIIFNPAFRKRKTTINRIGFILIPLMVIINFLFFLFNYRFSGINTLNSITLFFSLFWLMFTFNFKWVEQIYDYRPFYKVVVLTLIVFVSVYISNVLKYKNIIEGYPKYNISFIIDTDTISTYDKIDTVFVGMTNEYIFIRNISKKTTNVYSKKEVKRLTISESN